MKLLQQILLDAGADTNRAFTVVPAFGGYFKSVKRVDEYTPEKVVLTVAKQRLTVTGSKLTIDKYFQQDLLIRGDITGVNIE
ncbi:MAG: YabP/YqfC family sporulation protein [Clostridia bacterium]|nr:YabP/YqfC family sporulation protein [Clostridia bacterium]MDE7084651.1 YabP/YqfC family sporulation protein [Clostridia bacterium]MDE7256895.1 YabP/YqfC family sporulation protein [Clostridia bacterium]